MDRQQRGASRCPRAARPYRPTVEALEDRRVLSTMTFTAPFGNGADNMLLFRNGNKVQLKDNGVLVQSQSLGGLTAITINGASGEDDTLTVDFSLGGLFAPSNGITFNNAPAVAGTDTLVVTATTGNDTIALATGSVTVDGSLVKFTNAEQLQVNALTGADAVTMTGTNPNTTTTVDAGSDTAFDSFLATLSGSFQGNLTVLHFEDARMHTGGDFGGHWSVQGSGTIQDLTVDGSITPTGMVMTEDINTIMVMGDVSGPVIAHGSGTITDMEVGGSITQTGMVMTEDLTSIMVMGDVNGTVMAQGSGTIGDMTVNGDIGPTGMVTSEEINTIMVMGTVDGTVAAHGSGTITNLDTGSVGSTGMVSAEDITNIMVMGDMSGTVSATVTPGETGTGTLSTMAVGGSTEGTVIADHVGTISATGGVAGSPVMKVIEGGVLHELVATRADNGAPTPPTVVLAYYYDSTGAGDPQVSIRVTNGDPNTSADDARFDLCLITDASAAKFNLGRIFANGTSGLRSLDVEGDLLTTVTPATLTFFGLPAGTPGGVALPLDNLGGVAVQGNITAGSVSAASVQAVAFGSVTANGITTPAEAANHTDAAGILAAGTQSALANCTVRVPFSAAQKVALFLDTGPGVFDVKDVLFADQATGDNSDTAAVTIANGVIGTVAFQGDGVSMQTSQPISTAITSTGWLGDLSLSSSSGVPDVTMPSMRGNLDTNGPIWGTVQTTVGDIGQALTNGLGTIIGTTTINTTQGIPGRIISRGSLVSRVLSQKELSGVLAAQGDLGVAYVNGAGQLVRFGGLLSNGQFSGSMVVLGNILGDVLAKNGLSGRIAARGRPIAGIAATRVGILGNVSVSGNIATTGAIVSGGVLGDLAGGTTFSSGAVKGILAAIGDINFGGTGDTSSAAIFENAIGANAAAINAIFTQGGTPLSFDYLGTLDGLGLILTDLAALHVGSGGTLTGPIP
jgi:hypothetical protein